jgi:predicted transcriptional regulator
MATAEIVQHVVLDDLDDAIVSTINAEGPIMLQELAHRLPKCGYTKLWYRLRSLEKWGLIRTGNKRRQVVCFAIGS